MTAVKFIHEIAKQREPDKFDWEEAKKLERQQIMDAANQNQFDDIAAMGKPITKGEQYYAETYGSKGSDERIVEDNKTITSQTEISDTEIEFAGTNAWVEYNLRVSDDAESFYAGWKLALKWYREQLKSK